MDLSFSNSYRSMLRHVRICGFPIPFLPFQSRLEHLLWHSYIVVVFFFSLYIAASSAYSIGVKATFQDLCTLGIVLSQMTNGILITFHYIAYQGRLQAAITAMDGITGRILASPLGHQQVFIDHLTNDRGQITLFTKVSISFNLVASVLYCLPMPLVDLAGGRYRARLPIPMLFIGLTRSYHQPVLFEIIILLEVFVLIYSSIKKIGNDCIFLSFFKIQSAYLKYLAATMRSLGEDIVSAGGADKDKRLSIWIKIHQDVVRSTNELVSIYAPIIVLYYTNLICIIAFGLFVQLKAEDTDLIQSGATALWISTLIFVLYLQSAVADELNEESEKVGREAYLVRWELMKRTTVDSLRLIILRASNPVSITAYRAASFVLNKETFLGFIANVITVYMGFSKIYDILNEKAVEK